MNNIKKHFIPGMVTAAALAGLGGGLLLNSLSANAATTAATATTSTTTAADTSTTAQPSQGGSQGGGGPHVANGITETVLTGDTATKATTAATVAEPGATVIRAETDAEGAAYEVHMQKSDGTMVTVKLDANFKVTTTESGM